jgi:raffinose/stachyose/melibiose transport system permease protein
VSASYTWKKTAIHAGLLLLVALNFLPLIIAVSSSMRAPDDLRDPLLLFSGFSFESYVEAFKKMHFMRGMWNSIVMTAIPVVVVVIITSMASYVCARMKTRLSRFLSVFFLAGLIIPGQLPIIPIFKVMSSLHLSSGIAAPVLMFITCSIPVSTFLFTGFIRSSVPVELEEAAGIDGLGTFRRFWVIVFPLILPVTVAVTITNCVWIWNDFFFPMLFISKPGLNSLPLAMLTFVGDKENPAQWNILFAACILSLLPILAAFAVLQKYFIAGLTVGGIKG